jgi:hypothetical protein
MERVIDQLTDAMNRISFSRLRGAGFFRSASAFLNLVMGTLKIVADYYPGRLHRAFVIDPPSLFSVLWKVFCHFSLCVAIGIDRNQGTRGD